MRELLVKVSPVCLCCSSCNVIWLLKGWQRRGAGGRTLLTDTRSQLRFVNGENLMCEAAGQNVAE